MNKAIYLQMHCHSRLSINRLSGEGVFHKYIWPFERMIVGILMKKPANLIRMANKAGVDFIVLTDHNAVTSVNEGAMIPGEEWGQKKGHANFVNLKRAIDPDSGFFKNKEPAAPKSFSEASAEARKQRAFISINHPFKSDSWLWGDESFSMADGIEIWNGNWNNENEKALKLWQKFLESGVKLWGTSGSDFHVKFYSKINSPLIAFETGKTKESVLDNLKNGQFSISKNQETPVIFLHEDLSYVIINYNGGLEMRALSKTKSEIISNPTERGNLIKDNYSEFVRLELWGRDGPLSFSNPVFL